MKTQQRRSGQVWVDRSGSVYMVMEDEPVLSGTTTERYWLVLHDGNLQYWHEGLLWGDKLLAEAQDVE